MGTHYWVSLADPATAALWQSVVMASLENVDAVFTPRVRGALNANLGVMVILHEVNRALVS